MDGRNQLLAVAALSLLIIVSIGSWLVFVSEPAQEQYRLADEARSKGNPQLCERLSEPMERDLCLRDVGASLKDQSVCAAVNLIPQRDQCYRQVGSSLADPSVCERIEDEDGKDQCLLDVAASANDTSPCGRISGNYLHDRCYLGVASALKDATICENIGDPPQKEYCRTNTEKRTPSPSGESGKTTPKNSPCRDTDSYWIEQEYLQGNISGQINGYAYLYSDACRNDMTLLEWDCVRDIPTAKPVICPLGCLSGRCLRYTCVDYHKEGVYDNPSNLTLFHPNGSVDSVYIDECVGKNHDILDVARCDPSDMSGMKWEKIDCTNGCANTIGYQYGKCL